MESPWRGLSVAQKNPPPAPPAAAGVAVGRGGSEVRGEIGNGRRPYRAQFCANSFVCALSISGFQTPFSR